MYDVKTANRSRRQRDPYYLQDRLAKLETWCRSPFTARGECCTVALAGVIMFLLFVAAAAIGG